MLVVDDVTMDRLLLGSILEKAGHEVYHAEDGEQALEIYPKKDIEVVVTDLQMPKVHGLELIMVLLTSFPEAAIIAVSGTGPDQLDMAEAVGAFVTLRKPIDREELLEAVANAVASD